MDIQSHILYLASIIIVGIFLKIDLIAGSLNVLRGAVLAQRKLSNKMALIAGSV